MAAFCLAEKLTRSSRDVKQEVTGMTVRSKNTNKSTAGVFVNVL